MFRLLLSCLTKKLSTRSIYSNNLSITKDKYNAVHIKSNPINSSQLVLQHALKYLKISENDGTTSVWVHLQHPHLHLVGDLCKAGFNIHKGKGQIITLNKWMIKNKPNRVVPFSLFHLSCGGLFINDGKVLLIQEKAGELKGKFGIPGGRADEGQTIKQCVEREVREQLGIQSQFQGILWMRQLTNYLYGSNDIYNVCLMKPKGNTLEQICICQDEIQKVQWVPLDNYSQFCSKNSLGTQQELANYVTKLHKANFDFSTFQQDFSYGLYKSLIDGKERMAGRHWFVR